MLFELLKQARSLEASDVHLVSGLAPQVRVQGNLQSLALSPTSQEELAGELRGLLQEQQWQLFLHAGEVDVAFSDVTGERYRLNAYRQGAQYALAIRLLQSVIPDCHALGLPESVVRLADLKQGLVSPRISDRAENEAKAGVGIDTRRSARFQEP